jgi:cytochrome c556
MKSLICAASVMTLLVVACAVSWSLGAAADDPATIDKIMESLNKGRRAPIAVLKTALKTASPDWPAVQKVTKNYAKVVADLPKNDPPKGDAADFKKLAKAFAAHAKALDSAAQKEDLAAAKTALSKMFGSCKTCHDAHRED